MVFACPQVFSLVFFLSGEGDTRGDPGSVWIHLRFEAWAGEVLCWWQWHGDKCSSVFCSLHYLHFKTTFNEKVPLSKSSVRGQTITCGNSIFWAVLSSGSSSAVSSLKRSVTPLVALPGLLSGDSFLCLMAWRQSKSSLADSCSSEKNWGVAMISASFCCIFLVKDLKAVLASRAWRCWILLCLGLKSCKTMKRVVSAVLVCHSYGGWWAQFS